MNKNKISVELAKIVCTPEFLAIDSKAYDDIFEDRISRVWDAFNQFRWKFDEEAKLAHKPKEPDYS